jgi:hypothetical protein
MASGIAHEADLGGGTGRMFRHEHAWCWNVDPTIPVTGEVYDEIQVDGTYLSGGWCLLLAMDGSTGTVIAWQWCDTEKTAAWVALLERIPPPRVVVTDGGSGLITALKQVWPETLVQRCLVHVQRNVRVYLTTRPRTDAGKALRAISLALTRITTREQATAWEVRLHEWHQVYGHLVTAKTYLRDARVRPAWARASRSGGGPTTGSVAPTGSSNASPASRCCPPTYARTSTDSASAPRRTGSRAGSTTRSRTCCVATAG